MLVSMEVYLRRGQRSLQRMLLEPWIQSGIRVFSWWVSGFFLSAASLLGSPQPLAAGLACALSGWRAATVALGAMMGYPVF